MLCIAMKNSPLSNLYRKMKLSVQKSVRAVVSRKSMKVDGEKGTVEIGQMLFT
jgi:hypothetical protein